jgi:hypothetical protein
MALSSRGWCKTSRTWRVRVVSMASAWVMAGRMVVSHRASIDMPVPGGRGGARLAQNACLTFYFAFALPIEGV